jgi:hypothetical protein
MNTANQLWNTTARLRAEEPYKNVYFNQQETF